MDASWRYVDAHCDVVDPQLFRQDVWDERDLRKPLPLSLEPLRRTYGK